MEQSNQKKVLILSILCMVVLLLSSSYAIMTNFTQKEDAITFTTGNLDMTILNGEETFSLINLNNKLPESDESGLSNATVIPITLKNTGTMLIGTYEVKLVSDEEQVSTLSDEYIRFSVSEDNITYSTPATLTDNDNIIFQGRDLDINQTKTIYLKIWVNVASLENGYDKTFYGALKINLQQQSKDLSPVITNLSDAGLGKITFTAVDNGNGVSEYCVNQNLEDTTNCTWYSAIVGEQTTDKIVEENGNYYVHIKDLKGNIGHSDVVVMDVNLTAELFAREKYGTDTGLVSINTDGTLYSGTGEIREYRYSGDSVNNYVFFDTDGDSVQDENEIWRIVGIFENDSGEWNFKLMRNTILTSAELPSTYTYNETNFTIEYGSTGNVYWNFVKTGTNYNDWTTAGLQYYLNGTDGYFGTLSSAAKALVCNNYKYYLGNYTMIANDSSYTSDTTIESYEKERNSNNIFNGNEYLWNGKIALLYPSDYGYSANSSYWSTTQLYNYHTVAASTSWIQTNTNHTVHEWLLSPSSYDNSDASVWSTAGRVSDYDVNLYYIGVRPTFYLVENARIKDAEGTSSDPYKVVE